MKQIKQLLSITLAILIVLPVLTFAAVPTYASLTKKAITFEAMSYSGAAESPITVADIEIDDDKADPVVLDSISITAWPSILTYDYNEAVNFTGLVIAAKYSDGSLVPISDTSLMTFVGDRALATEDDKDSAKQTVTVNYQEKIATFQITVLNPVTSIKVKSGPDKIDYKYGENISFYNLIIEVTRLDGTTKELYAAKLVDNKEVINEGFTFDIRKAEYEVNEDRTNLYSDTVTIRVYYAGKETTFDITVNNDVSKIEIVELPNHLTYLYGMFLNEEGMVVNATHLDGTVEEDIAGYNCSPGVFTEVIGVQSITVSYEEKTDTFDVTVLNPVNSLSLVSGPEKTLYKTGEDFSPSGITVRAGYLDGSAINLTSGFFLTGFNSFNQVMGQIITLTYSHDGGTESVTFPVDIFAPSVFSTGGAYEMNYGENVPLTPSIPAREAQSEVTYGYWISDKNIACIDGDRVYGLRRGTVTLRVTATEIIEKDGQTLTFEYSERTTVRVKLTFWQWFFKYFVLFGWLGFDIYI